MFLSIIFLIELFILFFLSQELSKILSRVFYRLTGSQHYTIHLLAFLFFPGVVVHELAHWFVAGILFVRVGDIEFLPKIQGNTVKLGSASIAKTDPFRRFLIGVAPILVGVMGFFLIYYYCKSSIPGVNWQTLLAVYMYFEIGNTMFSSKKDMEGALGLFIAILVIYVFLFYFGGYRLVSPFGLRIHINAYSLLTLPAVVSFTKLTDLLLLIPILGDILFICGFFIIKKY